MQATQVWSSCSSSRTTATGGGVAPYGSPSALVAAEADALGAQYITHSVFWRTRAQNVRENVTYFEHPQKEKKLLPNRGAKYIMHSDVS